MRLILSGAAILAASFVFGFVQPISAQSIRALGGPAEAPPAGFQGQQYVDSRGCVFMRAGLGGQISWVARIGRDRRPICNDVPMAQAAARLAAPESASQTMPQAMTMEQQGSNAVGAPIETVASNMQAKNQLGLQAPTIVPGYAAAAAPILAPILAPQPVAAAPTYVAKPVAGNASCPASAPVLERMDIQSGGTVLVCTRGDGGAMGWVSPASPVGGGTIQNIPGQQVGYTGSSVGYSGSSNAHLRQNALAQYAAPTAGYVQTEIAGTQIIAAPIEKTNYVAAWKDDRLNPLRGQGTAEGWAMQAQIWTQKSPAKLVAKQPVETAAPQLRVMQSSMSAADAGGARYVQVGTFANAQNVANVSGALAAMGLPVTKSAMTKAGRDLVVVLAGPFENGQAAQQALGMAHQAGFGDAFLR